MSSWTPYDQLEGENPNFIQGVTKNGQPIFVLVRPECDGRFVVYSDLERQVVGLQGLEVWVQSPAKGVRSVGLQALTMV